MIPMIVRGGPAARPRLWLALALATGLLGSACAKKAVVVAPPPPPLAVPVVPPRLVGPVMVEEEPPPPVEEAPEPAPRTPPRAPRVTRGGNPGTTDGGSKPADAGATSEPAKTEPASPDAAPPPNAEQAPPLLRTPETANDSEAIRRVRDILARAESNLSKVNYKALSNGAKAQHDTASRFITQAEDALKTRSFTFARYLADKAEIISSSLLNR